METSKVDSKENMKQIFEKLGIAPELYSSELEFVLTSRPWIKKEESELEKPKVVSEEPPKIKEFNWQDGLRELVKLITTDRLEEKKPTPKKKKKWLWSDEGAQKETLETPSKQKPKRKGVLPRKTILPVVDYCHMGLESFESAGKSKTRATKRKPVKDEQGKFVATCVRFAHNKISSWIGFDSFLEERFSIPSCLEWVDLSYNKIATIDPVLLMLPRLKTLYLHCNCLNDLDEVRKLRYLPRLRTVTLFGNPIEATADYRLKMIAAIPSVKRFDWSIITPSEADLAKMYIPLMKEREMLEEKERQQEILAAEARKEKELKKLERKRRREQEQKKATQSEQQVTEEKKVEEVKPEKVVEKIHHEEEHKSPVEEEVDEATEEPLSSHEDEATEEEKLDEEEVEDEVIFPADLTDPGPPDVKGKRKLNPDFLETVPPREELRNVPSEVSFLSAETFTVEDIRQQFYLLKEMEANMDQDYF